jgi:hypothetical protein
VRTGGGETLVKIRNDGLLVEMKIHGWPTMEQKPVDVGDNQLQASVLGNLMVFTVRKIFCKHLFIQRAPEGASCEVRSLLVGARA